MKVKYITVIMGLLLSSMLFLSGCTFFETVEDIKVVFPDWPPELPELAGWKITTATEFGISDFYIEGNVDFVRLADYVVLPGKNRVLSIQARPVNKTSNGERFLFFDPAGAVYPAACNSKRELCLTWENGFTAALCTQILSQKETAYCSRSQICRFAMSYNWNKLSETLVRYESSALEKGLFYNPWHCNMENALVKLGRKSFTATALNQKGLVSYELDSRFSDALFPYIPENLRKWELGKEKDTQVYIQEGKLTTLLWKDRFINLKGDGKNLSVSGNKIPIYKE